MSRTANLDKRNAFLATARKILGDVDTVTRADLIRVMEEGKVTFPQWIIKDDNLRLGRGEYTLPRVVLMAGEKVDKVKAKMRVPKLPPVAQTVPTMENTVDMALHAINMKLEAAPSLIPDKTPGYVPFGHFQDVRKIISSRIFYPVYITGQTGNGKTLMIEQIGAVEGREIVRTNITVETDEDDLIGGFRLIDGRTVWQNGPVVVAMERGAILLLDEVDLGSNKLMCLQPILEGKPIYLKKINKVIHPQPGFNIIATANTKGKGSDDGRYIGTNVMNEAFLERFSVTLEQDYPEAKVEVKILNNILQAAGVDDKDFAEKLVTWAGHTRTAFNESIISELISTRRLVHIIQAYLIFNRNREKAVNMCLNRFDVETKNAILDLYMKLDAKATAETPAVNSETENDEIKF
jgi:AAA domain (dynein-related subfamily)/CbbQ/NirQ/NorQ C-terminal